MFLKISVQCPFCIDKVEWIYDVDDSRLHRQTMGCTGGCTAVQEVSVQQVSESEVIEFLEQHPYPLNNLNLED
jgi:hypothetical protein